MDRNYYTAMVFLSVLTALVQIVLIGENARLKRDKKQLFMAASVMLAAGAIAEYLVVFFEGTQGNMRFVLTVLKIADLSMPPFLIILVVAAFNGLKNALYFVPFAVVNTFLQITSGFNGFIFYFDTNNVYRHSTYYWLYILMYCICGAFFFFQCFRFSRQYQNRSSASLLAILTVLIAGLSIHLFHSDVRADWLTLTISYTLFYIYYSSLVEQMDSLTQLLDRKSYDMHTASLYQDAVIIVFDIDYFKEVNDTYGHEAGDRCLRTVSAVIKRIYARYGLCYRIGGDEFCVIMTKECASVEYVNSAFFAAIESARAAENDMELPNVSLGYALFRHGNSVSVTDVINEADAMMYRYKNVHRRSAVRA